MARFIAGLSTVAGTVLMLTGAASATPFSFSTGDVDGKIAAASRYSVAAAWRTHNDMTAAEFRRQTQKHESSESLSSFRTPFVPPPNL